MSRRHRRGLRAFTLVELVVTLAIAGAVLAVSIPFGLKFYDSMQYRHAVGTVVAAFMHARQAAVHSGTYQDVTLDPGSGRIDYGQVSRQLPESVTLVVHSAAELARDGKGVVRFYPEGGSTGGDVEIESSTGVGVRITVDWLMGGVSQEPYAIE